MRISDWSSDVCSSDLEAWEQAEQEAFEVAMRERMGAAHTAPPVDPATAQRVPDFRGRYYYSKFQVTELDSTFHTRLRTVYLEGLMWCLAYYVKGCFSWTWYYPDHSADRKQLVQVKSE